MDATHFDSVTRRMTRCGSRRAAFAALLTGSLGAMALSGADAKKKKKKKKKRKDSPTPSVPLPVPVPASPPGSQPSSGPTCNDGIRNGAETDVDCGGGTCRRCRIAQACLSRNDCASGLCPAGTCQACLNAGDCGTDTDGNMCACRDHESGQRFCSKINAQPDRVFPAGTPCSTCQGNEQCFLINGGADGIECIPPCGA